MEILLEIAQIPRSTYYYHVKRQAVPDKYKRAKEEIASISHENRGRYGYRRITMELHNRGICINHKTVQHLMKEIDLVCRVRMKKYHSYKGEVGKIAPNLLERDFEAEKPNQKWATDVTEFSLFGQKLYLSPILDLCSRDIVSYTISDRPVLSMVTEMLDKAVIENFFGLLKSELLYLQKFTSMEHFKAELIDYLDYYNNHRSKAKLKGLPPAIHRQQALEAA